MTRDRLTCAPIDYSVVRPEHDLEQFGNRPRDDPLQIEWPKFTDDDRDFDAGSCSPWSKVTLGQRVPSSHQPKGRSACRLIEE